MSDSATMLKSKRFQPSPKYSRQLEDYLRDEDAEDQVVAQVQPAAVVRDEILRCLQADQHGVEEDEPYHEGLEPAGFDDASRECLHNGG
jgi:hypothetical protein